MPRIIVTTDPSQLSADVPVLLDEQVHSVHLSTGHAASQLVERIAWAISDAENVEGTGEQRARSLRRAPRRAHLGRSSAQLAIRA
jgi:hypothetical protein